MDTTSRWGELLGLAAACADSAVLEGAIPYLLRISEADFVVVLASGSNEIALSAPVGRSASIVLDRQ